MKITHDLDGNLIVKELRCKNCGFSRGNHKAKTLNCPLSRTRFTPYHTEQFYTPRDK